MKDSSSILKTLCTDRGIRIVERFGHGGDVYVALNNDGVYKVVDADGRILVLKLALSRNSIAEIQMNRTGYRKLREAGLGWFIPEIVSIEVQEGFAFIFMEYCGEDFLTAVKKSSSPTELYIKLLVELKKVYRASRHDGEEGKKMVASVMKMVIEQYERYLSQCFGRDQVVSDQLAQIESVIRAEILPSYCFSSWDFTPENMFLNSAGLKYVDPHEDVMGIPIIDLACFSGLLIFYDVPESEKGYELFEKFALTDVPPILSIPERSAERLFLLGRILQCFLSSRYRIDSNPEKAHKIFRDSLAYLNKCVNV